MIVAGFDVGALTTKAVLLNKTSIAAYDIVETRAQPEQAVQTALNNALKKAGFSPKKVKRKVATGWGRKKVGFVDKVIGEVPCLSKGARWLVPSARTVIDVGGQTSNVIILTPKGKVLDYATNDKCAAGSGKFLEIVADALELDINEIGPLSLDSNKKINISNQCVVFAESEVINHVNEGEDATDIIAGVNYSIASRLATLANRNGFQEEICITGGVAKNIGVVKSLEDMLKTDIKKMPEDPQIIGALGAAIVAKAK